MRTQPFNIERAQKAVTNELWAIQHRQKNPDNTEMAYFGESRDKIKGVASPDGAEVICTMNNLFPNLLLDALAGPVWESLAKKFAAVIVVRLPEGSRCNACSLVNSHLPSCPAAPLLKQLAELHYKEKNHASLG